VVVWPPEAVVTAMLLVGATVVEVVVPDVPAETFVPPLVDDVPVVEAVAVVAGVSSDGVVVVVARPATLFVPLLDGDTLM
jgi:hypothetical protein